MSGLHLLSRQGLLPAQTRGRPRDDSDQALSIWRLCAARQAAGPHSTGMPARFGPMGLRGARRKAAGVPSPCCSLPRSDAPNLAGGTRTLECAADFRKPEVAIRPGSDSAKEVMRWYWKLGKSPGRRDAPDPAARPLCKPEVAIGAGGDVSREAAVIGKRELGDLPDWRDTPDHIRPLALVRKPEVAIRPGGDAIRLAEIGILGGIREWELGDLSRGRDAPDLAVGTLIRGRGHNADYRKPEVAIRPGSDANREAVGNATGGRERELGDLPDWGDAPNLVAQLVRKPEVATRPGGDATRAAVGGGQGKLRDAAPRCDAPNLAVVAPTRVSIKEAPREPEIAIRSGGDAAN